MAISQDSKLTLVVAFLAVLFIGSADAWYSNPPKCPKGFMDCNPRKPGCETCVDVDPYNCGACHRACKTLPYVTTKCVRGSCTYTCKPGYANCDYNLWKNGCETSTGSDPKNCGQCGKCCPVVPNADSACKGGQCTPPVCKPGYANCDYNWKNGCETSTSSDPKNCGKCGNCCISPPNAVSVCSGGKCTPPKCNPGYGDCDNNWKNGCEKSLTSDIFNCGKCGYCCPVTLKGGEATCSAGKCGQQCKKGTQYDNKSKCCVPIPIY